MQVTCPSCRARYAVDPLAIGPSGRTVQCARCNERWFQIVKLEPTPPPQPASEKPAAASPTLGSASEAKKPPDSAVKPGAKPDRPFIDTMPIPDLVIRPSMKGGGLPALIEPKTERRLGLVLAAAVLLLVVVAAGIFYFRQDILEQLPAEWRSMLRFNA